MPQGSNVDIRQGCAADLPQINAIAQSAYVIYQERMDRKPFPMLDDYSAHIEQHHLSVLEAGGQVHGFIVLLPVDDHTLMLDNVAVRPESQGQGYGRMLIEYAENEGRKRSCSKIILYTNQAMTENQKLYPHLGFKVSHRISEKGYRRIYYMKEL